MLFNAWRIWNKSLPRSKYALFSDSLQRTNSQSVMKLRANFEVKSRWKTQWFASNYLITCLILPCHLAQIARWSPPYCFIIMTMWQNNRREVGEQFGMDCTLKSLVFVICVSFSIFATRYELCSWKSCICNMCCRFPYSQLGTSCTFESPTLASEVSLRGDKINAWNEPGTGSAFSYLLRNWEKTKPVPGLKITRYRSPEVGSFLVNRGLSKA